MVIRSRAQTSMVKVKAIAEALPRGSESISTAGTNAESRHPALADVVKDAGRTRPAERDHHNE